MPASIVLPKPTLVSQNHTPEEWRLQGKEGGVNLVRLWLHLSVKEQSGELTDVIACVASL